MKDMADSRSARSEQDSKSQMAIRPTRLKGTENGPSGYFACLEALPNAYDVNNPSADRWSCIESCTITALSLKRTKRLVEMAPLSVERQTQFVVVARSRNRSTSLVDTGVDCDRSHLFCE